MNTLRKTNFKDYKKTKIIYFSNPNNPMSFYTEKIELERCLDSNKDILFICDEAYFEFSKSP